MDKHELLKYIGNLSQIGGCRHYTLGEGWGRGMRAIDVNTGSGLQYTVLPDRGMDLSLASFKGTNLVYISCNGETHPSFYESAGAGWLRTFAGGLLTTCGLTHLGPPCTDNGEQLGLHGRYSTIPVRQFADVSDWEGNEYYYKVKGIIEEGSLFGNKLRMEREIASVGGQNMIRIADKITNFGNKKSPYTILYHMNFGYPLLSEVAELVIDPLETLPRDTEAMKGMKEFRSFIKPQAEYSEQVFFHTLKGNQNGEATITLKNRQVGIAVNINFNINKLPYVNQWKMMGYGEYVLGIEPSNVLCKSRNILREENALPLLQPDESITNILEISVNDI
ncbi:MAG: aldose 1-epimerase family protein [Bacteroidales bacterium]|nr:aldose 1-epimerase family protein [Bacteroidales bacterium]